MHDQRMTVGSRQSPLLPTTYHLPPTGQIEIMGLLLIVVLIAVAFLFVLVFAFSDGSDGDRQAKDSIIASSAISVLRKTTAPECRSNSFQELLEDCSQGQVLECTSGATSCEVAESLATESLGALFEELGRDYVFSIDRLPYFAGKKIGKPCPLSVEKEAHEEPVPVDIGYEVVLRLEICGVPR